MSKVITLHEPDGSSHDYRILPFEELTIADWYAITNPPIDAGTSEAEATYELIRRWVRIPKTKLRRMKPADVEALVTALGTMLGQATKARMDEWTPEATFTWAGITYTVPQNVEADTTFGQWADINARLETLTSDVDMLPVILAILLVEEGQEYDGDNLDARISAMRHLPVEYAMKLAAFFFASGTRLQDVMSRHLSQRLMSGLQVFQQVANDLSAVTDGLPPSTDLPSSSPSS
jgi:hypothetical protein